jgi:hypothetical protein
MPELEDISQIASQILMLLDNKTANVLGTGLNLALSAWQTNNTAQFKQKMDYELKYLGQRKLDREFIHSDEFKEFLLKATKDASETKSEAKQKAFACLLTNTAIGSFDSFKDKHLLRRILDQISESELLALAKIHEAQLDWQFPNNDADDYSYQCTNQVVDRLGWSQNDARMATEGLRQLQLISIIDGFIEDELERPQWISEIGKRFILAVQSVPKLNI